MSKFLDLYRIGEGEGIVLFWLKETLYALLTFAAFWVLSRIVRYLLVTWGPKLTSFTSTDLDDRILLRVTPPTTLFIVFAGLYYAVKTLPLPPYGEAVAAGLLFIVNIVLATNIGYRVIDELLKWYTCSGERMSPALSCQLVPVIEKTATIFLGATALIITLKHFNYDILSLVTALGVGSLAIGMAAKDTLANMISGFTIMIDRPFRIGDRIQLAKGQAGDVVDIGLRSTKIRNPDNTFLIIPNSDLCNSTVINLSFPDSTGQGKVEIKVAYGADAEEVKALLAETALEVPEVLRDPAPAAFFTAFGDTGMSFLLIFWAASYTEVFGITDRINTLLLRRLADRGIALARPTIIVSRDAGNTHG